MARSSPPPGYTQPNPTPSVCRVPTPSGNAPNPKPGPSHPGYGYAEGAYLTISAVSGVFGETALNRGCLTPPFYQL